MRISLFLVLISTLQILAGSSYSQSTRLTLDMKNVTIKDVLSRIEEQSNFYFLYDNKLIDVHKKVDMVVQNEQIDVIVNKLFGEGEVNAVIRDRHIILTPAEGFITQQSLNVSGKVTDSSGAPLPGVTVVVKRTTKGIITNTDGNYSLSNVPGDATLVFSFVGMKTQEISVAGKSSINVNMEEDAIGIEEVVAIGYGTVKKSDLTGSVSKVQVEKVSERAITSIEQMLQGQIAGVQITQNSGALGSGISFNIRGTSSITGSTQPLIVIDGYPIDSDNNNIKSSDNVHSYLDIPPDNALSNLNPNDIESVEILKDASAAAIYGSRASNGVVLITTKHGKAGTNRIEFNYRFDVSQIRENIDVLNTEDYINYRNEAYRNSGRDSLYTSDKIQEYLKTDNNWQDLVYKTAITNDYQLTLSGGEEKMKYAVAFSYLGQEGIVKNTKLDRGTIRINLNRELNKNLKFGVNMSAAMSKNKGKMQSAGRIDPSSSVITGALLSAPIVSPYTVDDEIDQNYVGNPLTMLTLTEDQNKVNTVVANFFADYKITKGLMFRFNGGVNSLFSHRDMYLPRGTTVGNLNNGYAYRGDINSFNYLTEYTLNFNQTYNKKHSFNAVAGYTWQEWITSSIGLSAAGFPNDNLKYYNLSSAKTINSPITSNIQWGLSSFLGRLVYSYDKRYLLTFTGRTDGSTRLADDGKWAFFPSLAFGWNVQNEKFMKQYNFISEFKIRASYGLSGNQAIAVGATQSLLNSVKGVINETEQTGYLLSGMPNKDLHWEITKQANAGVDLAFLDRRITFSFDYYHKRTEDLLISLSIPPSNGFTTYNTNQGTVENKGYEFELNGKILSGKFKWDASGNISVNKNKIVDLGGVESFYGATFLNTNITIAKVGQPIGMYYGYSILGVYQNQAEADAGPTDAASPNKQGSFKFEDISGPNGVPDGMITADDRKIIGNPYPDFIFGISNNFSWKGVSLSFLVQGAIGQDIYNINRVFLDGLAGGNSYNVRQEAYDNRWTGEGTSNRYPMATTTLNPFVNRPSNYVVEDGSFVRLKNITLSYILPIRNVSFIKNMKVFMSAGNLLTWTSYKGYDPEISSRSEKMMMTGIDIGSIPQYRTFSMGINVGF